MGVGQIVDVPDQDRQLDPVPATPAQDCLRALPKPRGGWRRLPARVEDRGTVMLLADAGTDMGEFSSAERLAFWPGIR